MSDYIEVDGLRIGPNRYRYLVEQFKEAKERIAGLESRTCRTCDGHGIIGGPMPSCPDDGGEPCPECSVFILRKQAEAIEACEKEFQGQLGVIMTLSQHAESLRRQADELERKL